MAKDSSSGLSSALAGGAETIVARATPAGRGGLAVIRVSGGDTRRVAASVCPKLDMDRGWRAALVEIAAGDGTRIDRAVALPYPAPRSYTGEDMLELVVHGSPWVVRATLDALTTAGARPAGPGEFTRRAVANGKLDLVQAEAINELASAETSWQARLARAQAEGLLSRDFSELRAEMVELLARLDAAMDFSHQEIAYDAEDSRRLRDVCVDRARALLGTEAVGRRVRDGVRVVIAGPPNSGKSTLFNFLLGQERAIVSPHAGTTRDLVETELEIAGVRVILVDTAGLARTVDPVEREGVRRARGAAADADAIVLLWPANEGTAPALRPTQGQPMLRVRSKWDLATAETGAGDWLRVSCRTGAGTGALRSALAELVAEDVVDFGGDAAIGERHGEALARAVTELERADFDLPELAAEAVRSAIGIMAELVGEVVTEDVLDRIFASFCIGK